MERNEFAKRLLVSKPFMEGKPLRNLIMAGTAGLLLTLGAASSYAVPPDSANATIERRLIEGRSAFVAPHHPSSIRLPGNDFGPGFNAPANPSKGAANPGDVAGSDFTRER